MDISIPQICPCKYMCVVMQCMCPHSCICCFVRVPGSRITILKHEHVFDSDCFESCYVSFVCCCCCVCSFGWVRDCFWVLHCVAWCVGLVVIDPPSYPEHGTDCAFCEHRQQLRHLAICFLFCGLFCIYNLKVIVHTQRSDFSFSWSEVSAFCV